MVGWVWRVVDGVMGTVTVTVMMMSSTVVVLTHDCGFLKGLRATDDGRKRRRGGGLPERSSLAGELMVMASK